MQTILLEVLTYQKHLSSREFESILKSNASNIGNEDMAFQLDSREWKVKSKGRNDKTSLRKRKM